MLCEMYQYGSTPLMSAARNGRLPVVEYLLERGADMEAKDSVSNVIVGIMGSYTSYVYNDV